MSIKIVRDAGSPADFVWLRRNGGGYECQIWHKPFVGTAGQHDRIVKSHPLTAGQATLDLDLLAEVYPAPGMENAA